MVIVCIPGNVHNAHRRRHLCSRGMTLWP